MTGNKGENGIYVFLFIQYTQFLIIFTLDSLCVDILRYVMNTLL